MFGFQATSQQLRDRIEQATDALVKGQRLTVEGDALTVSDSEIEKTAKAD